MNPRTALLSILLVVPALALLALGPRGRVDLPEGRAVVRYWERWAGVEGRAMMRIVDRFNRTVGAEKGIWVEYASIGNIEQRLLIAAAGGDPPDLSGMDVMTLAQFADQGALMPLDDLAAEFGITAERFKPIWWEMGRCDGRLFALPSTPYTCALLYNRRLFREAGLDPDRPPRTLAELAEYCGKLTRFDPANPRRITHAGFTLSPAMLGWWHWVWPFFFDARPWDGARFDLSSAQVRASMQWVASMRYRDGVAPVQSFRDWLDFEGSAVEIEGPQNPFLHEKLAMVFQGPWMCNWIAKYTPDLDYGIAPFPSSEPGLRNAFASGDLFCVPRGAKNARGAMKFLSWLLTPENMNELCREHGKVSPLRDPGPEFFATHPNPHIRVFDDLASAPAVFGYPKMPTFRQASDEMRTMLDRVLKDPADIAAAIAAAQKKIDAVLADHDRARAAREGGRP